MSKIAAILYSSLILIQSFNIGFEDVSKFKVLLEHAEYHQENYDHSFFEFLTEHYGNPKIAYGNSHEEHDDLPFKTSVHTNASFTFNTLTFDIELQTFTEFPFNFLYKEFFSSFERPSIFQPPKFS